jgi:hypothetical protein
MREFLSSRKTAFSFILLPGVIEIYDLQNVLYGALGCREELPGDPRLLPLTTNFRLEKLISK